MLLSSGGKGQPGQELVFLAVGCGPFAAGLAGSGVGRFGRGPYV